MERQREEWSLRSSCPYREIVMGRVEQSPAIRPNTDISITGIQDGHREIFT